MKPVSPADFLRRHFAYDEWANREVIAAIRKSAAGRERSLQLMAHILSAEGLWLERLKQQKQTSPVWPEFDIDRCEVRAVELGDLWSEYLKDADLAQDVHYKNTKGEDWSNSVGDILTHVVFHSAYHRGQIATHMRASGETPAYTDFIHGVRQGMVKY
jgi:uncharacterized damage-inducible protein DinB